MYIIPVDNPLEDHPRNNACPPFPRPNIRPAQRDESAAPSCEWKGALASRMAGMESDGSNGLAYEPSIESKIFKVAHQKFVRSIKH